MKKSFISLLAVMVLMLAGCQNQGGQLEFRTYSHRDSIDNNTLSYLFDVHIELPASGLTSDVLTALRNNIVLYALGEKYVGLSDRKLLSVYSDSSYAEYLHLFEEDLKAIDENVLFKINCETVLRGAVSFEKDSLLNYEVRIYTYNGGAHGMSTVTNYIFDLRTGKIINEMDIFGKNIDRPLHHLLVEQARLLRNDSILPSETDIFSDDMIVANGNVELGENGLSYIFNPYEIAPYVYGIISIPLDNAKVLPLLDRSCPVYDYIKSKSVN